MNDTDSPLTQSDILARRLLFRWIPKWHGAFCDPATGLFHERLGHAFRPLPMPYKRLLTQCRQLAMYADAARHRPDLKFAPKLYVSYRALIDHFFIPETGGWRFSLDPLGQPLDDRYDLYALAFVIFALAHYGKAYPDSDARDYALKTLGFIDQYFRMSGKPGFAESLSPDLKPIPQLRRHESHMHLLEACLFAFQTWGDTSFKLLADEVVTLFHQKFYNRTHNTLSEYFDDELNPASKEGCFVLEPGHYGEWIWLLKKYTFLTGTSFPEQDSVCTQMLVWANTHGWDSEYGGIYDELNDHYQVIADTKRLWPFGEILKANALLMDSGLSRDDLKANMSRMMRVFVQKYMDPRGFWTEWLNRDLSPATDYMPGTTPYHVYFSIMETRETLYARGKPKSLLTPMESALYKIRRRLSDRVRHIKTWIRRKTA